MSFEQASIERLRDRLSAVLSADSLCSAQMVTVTLPAPTTIASHVFAAHCTDQSAYYFAAGDREGDVGLGSVVRLEVDDLRDIGAIETKAQQILDSAIEIGIDAAAKAPRFYGGIAYCQSPAPTGPWRDFGRVEFELPRFRYLTDGHRASLTLHLRPQEAANGAERESWIRQTTDLLAAIALKPDMGTASSAIRRRRDQPDADQWLAQVAKALTVMQNGELAKVVLAREIILDLVAAPSVMRLLESLRELSPETTRFAFRKGSRVFLGATPERLVKRVGSEIRTEAVAGSIRALDVDAAEHLLQSDKERHEHDLVVRELIRKLELLGARPESSGQPTIRQLRHVLHLATTITARLFGPPHVLSLVARLHPTPAVGGVPEAKAAEFMRDHEGFERGWYAAPIGWFDAQGDGEFVVGLRSGLLEANVLRLYAGAGIVENSVPERELQETELKLQSLLEALGHEPSEPARQSSALREPRESLGKLVDAP